MTKNIPFLPGLSPVADKEICVWFDGGRLSSDGGVVLLRRIESGRGLTDKLASCLPDERDPSSTIQSHAEMTRARMFAIARSRCRNGWWEYSARSFSQHPDARRFRCPSSPPGRTQAGPLQLRLGEHIVSSLCAKLQGSLSIPPFGDECLQHLAFVIDRPPEVVRFAIDTHENFDEMPMPGCLQLMVEAPFSNLRGEYRTEPVPLGANRFVADIDTAFVEQIFDLLQRKQTYIITPSG